MPWLWAYASIRRISCDASMSATNERPIQYSATVRARLAVRGHDLDVAQLGPGYLILRDLIDSPATDAVLTLQVDGQQSVYHLWLPNGLSLGQPKVAISPAVETNLAA